MLPQVMKMMMNDNNCVQKMASYKQTYLLLFFFLFLVLNVNVN